MDRITGLREYINSEEVKEKLGIPRREKLECRLLQERFYSFTIDRMSDDIKE